MSTSTLTQLREQAVDLIRRVSGAKHAMHSASHTATHLGNVERWAQQEFLVQRSAHEHRLTQLESRVQRLEKVQNALTAAGDIRSCPDADAALAAIKVRNEYYEFWQGLLAEIDRNESLFADVRHVLDLQCGAAKCSAYLQDKVESYCGVEPSPILRAAAAQRVRDVRFSFIDTNALRECAPEQDVVLLLAEKQRWSVFDLETLLGIAESKCAASGRIVLHVPYSFEELATAGWDLRARLAALGLQLTGAPRTTSAGCYAVIAKGDV